MTGINQPIPSPLPSVGLSASGPNQTGSQDGIIIAVGTRSITGAVTGAASGTPTGTVSGAFISDDMHNPNNKGVRLFILASGAATGTLTTKIQVIDPNTGTWIDLPFATTAALNGTGPGVVGLTMTVYPGLTGIANDATGVNINQHLGPRWRVVGTVALASMRCSVGGDYLL